MINTFIEDLKIGQKYESAFATYLNKRGYTTTTSSSAGYFPGWDIQAANPKTNITSTFEIKADLKQSETGNICIEYQHTELFCGSLINTPSGLTSSTATWWIYCFENDDNFYAIPRAKIFELINDGQYQRKCFGGYQHNSDLRIFDKHLFVANCTILYN